MGSWRRAGSGVAVALVVAGCGAGVHPAAPAVGPFHNAWHSENAFSAASAPSHRFTYSTTHGSGQCAATALTIRSHGTLSKNA